MTGWYRRLAYRYHISVFFSSPCIDEFILEIISTFRIVQNENCLGTSWFYCTALLERGFSTYWSMKVLYRKRKGASRSPTLNRTFVLKSSILTSKKTTLSNQIDLWDAHLCTRQALDRAAAAICTTELH